MKSVIERICWIIAIISWPALVALVAIISFLDWPVWTVLIWAIVALLATGIATDDYIDDEFGFIKKESRPSSTGFFGPIVAMPCDIDDTIWFFDFMTVLDKTAQVPVNRLLKGTVVEIDFSYTKSAAINTPKIIIARGDNPTDLCTRYFNVDAFLTKTAAMEMARKEHFQLLIEGEE